MAGERKGITYEACVKIALDELVKKGKLRGTVFWNEKPDRMTIEPDFTIGPDKDHPTHVFLVTHSGSAKNSDMKFWRNIGELAEAKVRLPKPARVYSIAFDAVIKEDLKTLQAAAFDGQLLVGDVDYGRRLQWWVDANGPGLPKDSDEKVEAIRAAVKDKSRSDNPKALLAELVKDLGTMIATTRPELDSLWALERARVTGSTPESRHTFVRRGLTKMVVFPNLADVYSLSTTSKRDFGKAAEALGFVTRTIAGVRVADAELLSTMRLVKLADARPVVDGFRKAAERWLRTLESLEQLPSMLAFLSEEWSSIRAPSGCYRLLKEQHEGRTIGSISATCSWPYLILCEIVKQQSGQRQSFGTAQLLTDIRAHRRDARYAATIARLAGTTRAVFRAERSIERLISVQLGDRTSKGSASLFQDYTVDMAEIAYALAKRLPPTSKHLDLDSIRAGLVQKIFYNDLATYRMFEPLRELIVKKVSTARRENVKHAIAQSIQTDIRDDTGRIALLRANNTLINWQSAFGSHTKDKCKELCGRAPLLRYSWNQDSRSYVKRPSVDRLLLVVDGTWTQSELESLVRSGWDKIFYADEIEQLALEVL